MVLGIFTDPLPSNRCSIVTGVGSLGNVFTESLSSNGSIRHNMYALDTLSIMNNVTL
jgi:hypothetical protein